jgi:hypothetical protein
MFDGAAEGRRFGESPVDPPLGANCDSEPCAAACGLAPLASTPAEWSCRIEKDPLPPEPRSRGHWCAGTACAWPSSSAGRGPHACVYIVGRLRRLRAQLCARGGKARSARTDARACRTAQSLCPRRAQSRKARPTMLTGTGKAEASRWVGATRLGIQVRARACVRACSRQKG